MHPLERYYPELIRRLLGRFNPGSRVDPLGALVPDPDERRRAQETLAQFAQDVAGQPVVRYAVVLVHAFMLGVWLGQVEPSA